MADRLTDSEIGWYRAIVEEDGTLSAEKIIQVLDALEAAYRELETCRQDRDVLACDNASMRARLARAELLAYSHADEA